MIGPHPLLQVDRVAEQLRFASLFSHHGNCALSDRPKIMQVNTVARFGLSKQLDICFAAKSTFERKRFLAVNRLTDFREQQATGLDRGCARIEWRKSTGEFVGVVKAKALYLVRQKFFGEGCLTRTACSRRISELQPVMR